jgi:parallel beta-helix repeat protein
MKKIFYLASLIFFKITIHSANYYCDPVNGSMTNNGSINSPWSTLEAVFNQGISFSGGDQIFLLSGNHGFPKITGINSSNVEIKPLSGHSPVINRVRLGNTAQAAFWLLNGLTIQSENVTQYPINLIDIYANSSNITVNNCTITSSLVTTTWNRNDWRTKTNNGILSKGTGHLFTNNTITNIAIGITMSSSSSEFTNNTIQYFAIDGIRGLGDDCAYIGNSILDNISVYYYSENHYDGFQSYSCCPVGNAIVNNVIIKQNTIINCTDNTRQFRGSMQGIGCFDGMYNNWTIENNVIIIDNWHGITMSGATNCKIANNTIIDPYDVSYQDPNDPQQFGNVGPSYIRVTAHKNDGGVYSGVLSSNNTVINNLVPTLANDANVGLVSNNILLGASSNYSNFFVNYNTYDLHLIASATAIDGGTNTNAPTVDIDGGMRPQGNSTDVGAYEYGTCNTSFNIIPPSQTSICEGESITLTTNASSTATWNNSVTDNVSFTPTETNTYTASVGSGNCITTHQITITVTPTPSFTPSADRVSVCEGDAITLTTDASSTATWNYGVIDNISFIPPYPQTYTATVTNGNCSHSEQISINVSVIPSLTINTNNTNICEGNSVTLNATTDGMNMSWDNNVQNNVPFTPLSSQTYIVTANNYGCSVFESIDISVIPTPSISILQNGNQLTANNTNGSLQWYLDGNPINGATAANHTINSVGVYTVSILDNNGCTNTSNSITIQSVTVQENFTENFTIYPNPTQESFKVISSIKIKNIQLFSIEGKLILETSNNNIDVSMLTTGVYFVKLATTNGSRIKKVVVE